MTVDMGPPELNGPKVPSTLPTNADGVVLKEPIQVSGGGARNFRPCQGYAAQAWPFTGVVTTVLC